MKTTRIACAVFGLVSVGAAAVALAQKQPKAGPATVDAYVQATFKGAPAEWQKKIEQDDAQKLCSEYRNELPAALFEQVRTSQQASVVFPADGNVLGDWKEGAKIAQNGRGGQFSDEPGTVGGGNCYACHQLSKAELSFGTMGPSLLDYGKIRKFSAADAKAAFAKVYNAQAVMPCSNMPRFGHTKALSEQQIKDVVAYLFDPNSPVNK